MHERMLENSARDLPRAQSGDLLLPEGDQPGLDTQLQPAVPSRVLLPVQSQAAPDLKCQLDRKSVV